MKKKKERRGTYYNNACHSVHACVLVFLRFARNHTYDASQEAGWREQQAWFFADRNQSARLVCCAAWHLPPRARRTITYCTVQPRCFEIGTDLTYGIAAA